MYSKILSVSAVALATGLVSAQTYSDCNPIKGDKCSPDEAIGGTVEIDFTKGSSDFFSLADGTSLSYDGSNGAVFTIAKEGQAPTITSKKYLFFGHVEVVVRASVGTGVVTSSVLQSDDLDEIDWEWLGGDTAQVQTNYFSKGDTSTYDRGGYSKVATPQTAFHTYSIDWTKDAVTWSIDGTVVRTLQAATATEGFPQTPMQLKLGTWVAGAKDAPKGTVDWAGGYTNYADAPFIGYYKSVKVIDYCGGSSAGGKATSYVYGDSSGSWQSIKVITDGSTDSSANSTSSSSSAPATTSATSTSSAASTMNTSTSTGSGSGNATVKTTGIGFAGSASESGSGSATAAVTTGTAKPTTNPSSGFKSAANVIFVGAGLLVSYLIL